MLTALRVWYRLRIQRFTVKVKGNRCTNIPIVCGVEWNTDVIPLSVSKADILDGLDNVPPINNPTCEPPKHDKVPRSFTFSSSWQSSQGRCEERIVPPSRTVQLLRSRISPFCVHTKFLQRHFPIWATYTLQSPSFIPAFSHHLHLARWFLHVFKKVITERIDPPRESFPMETDLAQHRMFSDALRFLSMD